jgi:quercetin dioxygenase-like cupin family protein
MTQKNLKFSLEDSVAYQPEAIVSKTILKTGSGSVTLFAFAAGESLSEHTTSQNALVVVTDGAVDITISGEKYSVQKGEMIALPAGEPHALKAVTDFKMILIMLKD